MMSDRSRAPHHEAPRSKRLTCCARLGAEVLSDDEANATAKLFKALGDPARVRIVNLLATSDEPVCACELTNRSGSPADRQPPPEEADEAGLLAREQRGKWAYFSIRARGRRDARGRRGPERSVLLMSTTAEELRDEVRERYAESARAVTGADGKLRRGSCCATRTERPFGEALYDAEQRDELPEAAVSRPSAAATRPPSPTCAKARSCSTSAPAAAST